MLEVYKFLVKHQYDVVRQDQSPRQRSRLHSDDVTTSYDKTAKLWDFKTRKCLAVFQHSSIVRVGDLSTDKRLLTTVTADCRAWIWEVASGSLLHGPLQHDHTLQGIFFSLDGRTVTTNSGDQIRQIWDVASGAAMPAERADGLNARMATGDLSGDQRRVAMTSHDAIAFVQDLKTSRTLTEPVRHETYVESAHLSDDGTVLLSTSEDGVIKERVVPRIPTPVPPWVTPFAEAICGRRVSASGENEIVLSRSISIPAASSLDSPANKAWLCWANGLMNNFGATGTNRRIQYWPVQ